MINNLQKKENNCVACRCRSLIGNTFSTNAHNSQIKRKCAKLDKVSRNSRLLLNKIDAQQLIGG